MATFTVDGKQVSYREYLKVEVEKERKESARRWALKQQALELLRQIGRAYRAYQQFLGDHPELAMQVPEGEIPNQHLYEQLLENLGHANEAPRCMYVKPDGLRCGSPRLKTGELCYTHQRMERARALRVRMPPLEDANSIQVAIMEVHRALLDHQIGAKEAGLLLYGLQTAAANLGRVNFHEAPEEMVLEDTTAKTEEKAAPEDTPEHYQKYRYETIDPDLRERLMEIGDEVDRRMLAREKAAAAPIVPERALEAGLEPALPYLTDGDGERARKESP